MRSLIGFVGLLGALINWPNGLVYQLKTVLVKKVQQGPQEIDILRWMTRTALELIGQSGMGYSFDTLEDDNDNHPYSRSVKRFMWVLVNLG